MKGKTRIISIMLTLVFITSVFMVTTGFASSSFGGNGKSLNVSTTTNTPKSASPKMYYYDPDTGVVDPPNFKIEACLSIDINAPEPEHLPGLGVNNIFNYESAEKVTIRCFSDDWISDGFYLSFVWRGPNGEVIDNLSEVFVPKPWAVVALWDYWEWVTLWKEMFTIYMAPGEWTVKVYFHWAEEPEQEAVSVGSVTFTLEGNPPTQSYFTFNNNNSGWTPPTFDIMTLCREVNIEAIQFDMMPPIGQIPDRSIIEGNKKVWAYVRFVNNPPKLLDEAFHVVFNFKYEDGTTKPTSPYALLQVVDVPHARTSFSGWDYWSDYYVAAIDFTPVLMDMWAGRWKLNIYAYPDWGEMKSAILLGTVHFTVQGGGVPEPPKPLPLPSSGFKIVVNPQPASDDVEFVVVSKQGRVYADNISINVYNLGGFRVNNNDIIGNATDSVRWNVDMLRNGAYIYVATITIGNKTYVLRGFIYVRRW